MMDKTLDVLQVLKKLPPRIFTRDRVTGDTIEVRRGVMGYFVVTSALTAEQLNDRLPTVPTPLQITAMVNGSMFGWETLGADVNYLARQEAEAKKGAK